MAIIYKLYNDKDCYVGSTIQTLGQRLTTHKSKNNHTISKKIIESKIFKMEIIEEVNLDSRFIREQFWIDTISTLKQQNVFRENKEEYRKKYIKEYQEQNKERISQQHKEYHEQNREKQLKQMKEISKKWYDENKEKLNKKCICECGLTYTYHHKTRHIKSKKHLKLLRTEEEEL